MKCPEFSFMFKKQKFIKNTTAVSILQDTLLFLVFISISAMILSPTVTQTYSNNHSINKSNDEQVQEILQTLLRTTIKNYSYKTASTYVDSFAEGIGINTTQSDGLYATLSNHVIGKQQYHKTIAQLITEQLATQYMIVLNHSMLRCNPFSGDAQNQLIQLIETQLNSILPYQTSYNLTAIWKPIQGISFGGKITLGEPIPPTTKYVTHQQLSLPFLPCIQLHNQSFCFSSYHLKNMTESICNLLPKIQNISFLQNTSLQISEHNRSLLITENISSLLLDFLIYGNYDSAGNLVIPSVLDIINSFIFHTNTFSLTKNAQEQSSSSSLSHINSFFDMCQQPTHGSITDDLSSYIFSSFGSTINSSLETLVLTTISDFINLIKTYVTSLIQPIVHSFSLDLTPLFLSTQKPIILQIENFIDFIFSHLSLSTAQIYLTVWRG